MSSCVIFSTIFRMSFSFAQRNNTVCQLNKAIENDHRNSGFFHWTMLVITRG